MIIHSGMNEIDDQVQAANQGDARQDLVNVVRRAFARTNARDEAAILPHVVRNFVRVEDDGHVEEAKKMIPTA